MMDLIIFISLVAIIATLLLTVINLALKNRKLATELLQSTIDHNIMLTKFAEELKKKEDVSIEKTDGFLKFISESRDLAFEYIEKIQLSLVKFKDEVGPEIEYMLTYGTASGDSLRTNSFTKIKKSFDELMNEALPKEDGNKK